MGFRFHFKDDTVSAAEFRDSSGSLTQQERDSLEQTRKTTLAHLEPIEARLERYHSYFTLGEDDYDYLHLCVGEKMELYENHVDMNKLEKISDDLGVVYAVNIGHANINIDKIINKKVLQNVNMPLASICEGLCLSASPVFQWISQQVSSMMDAEEVASLFEREERCEVLLSTSHQLSETEYCITQLSGGFFEQPPEDKTFKMTSNDPIVGVPLPNLMNHAFKSMDVPAFCRTATSVTNVEQCATVEWGHDPYAFLTINLSNGFLATTIEWGQDGAVRAKKCNFTEVEIPANNIDQAYNFVQNTSRRNNFLGRMVSTESISALARMAWYHVKQNTAHSTAWDDTSLDTYSVLKAAYDASSAKQTLTDWMGSPCTDNDAAMFAEVCEMVVERATHILAGVITGAAQNSSRVYDSFGMSRVLIRADELGDFPQFLDSVEKKIADTLSHGKIEILYAPDSYIIGACVIAGNMEAIKI